MECVHCDYQSPIQKVIDNKKVVVTNDKGKFFKFENNSLQLTQVTRPAKGLPIVETASLIGCPACRKTFIVW